MFRMIIGPRVLLSSSGCVKQDVLLRLGSVDILLIHCFACVHCEWWGFHFQPLRLLLLLVSQKLLLLPHHQLQEAQFLVRNIVRHLGRRRLLNLGGASSHRISTESSGATHSGGRGLPGGMPHVGQVCREGPCAEAGTWRHISGPTCPRQTKRQSPTSQRANGSKWHCRHTSAEG